MIPSSSLLTWRPSASPRLHARNMRDVYKRHCSYHAPGMTSTAHTTHYAPSQFHLTHPHPLPPSPAASFDQQASFLPQFGQASGRREETSQPDLSVLVSTKAHHQQPDQQSETGLTVEVEHNA